MIFTKTGLLFYFFAQEESRFDVEGQEGGRNYSLETKTIRVLNVGLSRDPVAGEVRLLREHHSVHSTGWWGPCGFTTANGSR